MGGVTDALVAARECLAHVCTGNALRCFDGNGCECEMAGNAPTDPAEALRNLVAAISAQPPKASAPVGVDVRSVIARAIGCGYSRGHQDTMEGTYTDVGYEDRVEYHGDLADELLTGDRDFAGIAALAQQPAAMPSKKEGGET